ncbi:hypothetical protein ABJI51_03425 [Amycolatopsis sp. NEAU-NG30]|uniref:Uncharacterized protein n=1 Tax=Amycolatopsis melonis TaxID=3156488 RepID=A0ABV0L7G3_9PSEU
MDRPFRMWTGLVAVSVTVVACGRAPEPSSAPVSPTSAALPATTPAPTSTAMTATPSAPVVIPSPPDSTPKSSVTQNSTTRAPEPTSKPVPPPPKPPDRWVFSAADRRSIEQQTGASFTDFHVDEFYPLICPHKDVCLHNAFKIDPGLGHPDEDCWVDHNIVPDPLYEGGTITWVVNNPCGPG